MSRICLLACLLFTMSFNQINAAEDENNESAETIDVKFEFKKNALTDYRVDVVISSSDKIMILDQDPIEKSQGNTGSLSDTGSSDKIMILDQDPIEKSQSDIGSLSNTKNGIRKIIRIQKEHATSKTIILNEETLHKTKYHTVSGQSDNGKSVIFINMMISRTKEHGGSLLFRVKKKSQTSVKMMRSTITNNNAMEKKPFSHFIIANQTPDVNSAENGAMFISSALPEGCRGFVFPINSYGDAYPYYTISHSTDVSFNIAKTSYSLNHNRPKFNIDYQKLEIAFNSGQVYTIPLWISQATFQPLNNSTILAMTPQQAFILEASHENSYSSPQGERLKIMVLPVFINVDDMFDEDEKAEPITSRTKLAKHKKGYYPAQQLVLYNDGGNQNTYFYETDNEHGNIKWACYDDILAKLIANTEQETSNNQLEKEVETSSTEKKYNLRSNKQKDNVQHGKLKSR